MQRTRAVHGRQRGRGARGTAWCGSPPPLGRLRMWAKACPASQRHARHQTSNLGPITPGRCARAPCHHARDGAGPVTRDSRRLAVHGPVSTASTASTPALSRGWVGWGGGIDDGQDKVTPVRRITMLRRPAEPAEPAAPAGLRRILPPASTASSLPGRGRNRWAGRPADGYHDARPRRPADDFPSLSAAPPLRRPRRRASLASTTQFRSKFASCTYPSFRILPN